MLSAWLEWAKTIFLAVLVAGLVGVLMDILVRPLHLPLLSKVADGVQYGVIFYLFWFRRESVPPPAIWFNFRTLLAGSRMLILGLVGFLVFTGGVLFYRGGKGPLGRQRDRFWCGAELDLIGLRSLFLPAAGRREGESRLGGGAGLFAKHLRQIHH